MELTLMAKFVNWDEIPVVLNVKQVAEILDVHINTVKRLIARGDLPASKIGRVLRVNKSDLRWYLGLTEDKD